MYKKLMIGSGMGIAASLLMMSSAFAAANPSGTGQPGADCANESSQPNGFGTSGFANAEIHYAGSDGTPSAAHAQSTHAVSQYDVACYQVSQNH